MYPTTRSNYFLYLLLKKSLILKRNTNNFLSSEGSTYTSKYEMPLPSLRFPRGIWQASSSYRFSGLPLASYPAGVFAIAAAYLFFPTGCIICFFSHNFSFWDSGIIIFFYLYLTIWIGVGKRIDYCLYLLQRAIWRIYFIFFSMKQGWLLSLEGVKGGDSSGNSASWRLRRRRFCVEEAEAVPAERVRL